ncbi:centromere protein C [Indicator indicator]|uniref:centromere protein C n=1 Tax=Indicator indicator TaxID=1002788 RepID=UPI0023DEB8CC|nr:centromere protein C [Indicator indicator]
MLLITGGGDVTVFDSTDFSRFARCMDTVLSCLIDRKASNRLENDDVLRLSPAKDCEDDRGLHFDDQNSPAAVNIHLEVENLEGPQTGRDENVVLVYSAPIPPPSSPPAEDQDIEIEDECEFLIDESVDASSKFWVSISRKNNKLKKDTSASPVSKSQPSKKKTESRKGKKRKIQAEVLTEWQGDDLDVRPELETEASDAEQHKPRGTPVRDSPVPSAGHHREQTVSPKKNLKSSKNLHLASKASQHLDPKKQTAKQKPPKALVAKRQAGSPRKKLKISAKKSSNKKPRIQIEESSDSEPGEEEMEREPAKLTEEFTSLPHQKLQTPTSQKLTKSENILQVLESCDDATNRSLVKALQYLIDRVKCSEVQQLPAKSSEKAPQKLCHRDSEGAFLDAENAESHMGSDSKGAAKEKQKLADVKVKSTKRKRHVQHGPQDSFAAEKASSCASGPVLEDGNRFASGSQCSKQDSFSPDVYEDLDFQVRAPFSDKSTSHKIVMPSNTPNVRRTKRIRLKPLEYWRGERVNYAMSPSGNLVVTGVVCPEPQSKMNQRKDRRKPKRAKSRKEEPLVLDHSLGDTAKPTIVLDPVTNEEVPLECVTTEMRHSCFFKDETVEIYKHLNTSAFATGKLILKPLKEKGHQCVHMDTIVFHVIYGKIITTLHQTSYYLTTGDYFYVPAGNRYNIRNLLDEESVLLFTQLKKDRPPVSVELCTVTNKSWFLV